MFGSELVHPWQVVAQACAGSGAFVLFCLFAFFLPSYFLSFSFVFLSFNVSGLLACVSCACLTQYDDITFHCLLPVLHYHLPGIVVSVS